MCHMRERLREGRRKKKRGKGDALHGGAAERDTHSVLCPATQPSDKDSL